MTDQQAFEAAINADPHDHTAKLALADWLDEHCPDRAAPCKRCAASGWERAGPGGQPKCPGCGNSLQNGVPCDSPHLRRCATCKRVWEPAKCPACGGAGTIGEGRVWRWLATWRGGRVPRFSLSKASGSLVDRLEWYSSTFNKMTEDETDFTDAILPDVLIGRIGRRNDLFNADWPTPYLAYEAVVSKATYKGIDRKLPGAGPTGVVIPRTRKRTAK